MDGRELCRRIKAIDRAIKVVVVTSLYTGIRYRVEAMRTFMADEYLPKPIDFARLYEILATFSSREGANRRRGGEVPAGMAV
jgi:DNA-binding response OmpR family regulator